MVCRNSAQELVPRELQTPTAVVEYLLDDTTPAATDTPPSESTEGDGAEAAAANSPIADEKVRGLHL